MTYKSTLIKITYKNLKKVKVPFICDYCHKILDLREFTLKNHSQVLHRRKVT